MSWRPKWYDALPVLAIGVFGMVGPEGWPRQVAVGLVTFLAAAAPALAEFGYLELFSYRWWRRSTGSTTRSWTLPQARESVVGEWREDE